MLCLRMVAMGNKKNRHWVTVSKLIQLLVIGEIQYA